jgi:hypothetical protein
MYLFPSGTWLPGGAPFSFFWVVVGAGDENPGVGYGLTCAGWMFFPGLLYK